MLLATTPTTPTTGESEGHITAFLQLVHGNTELLYIGLTFFRMDNFDNLSASEKAEAAELQRMIAVEQQKAQFQAQVRMLTVLAY